MAGRLWSPMGNLPTKDRRSMAANLGSTLTHGSSVMEINNRPFPPLTSGGTLPGINLPPADKSPPPDSRTERSPGKAQGCVQEPDPSPNRRQTDKHFADRRSGLILKTRGAGLPAPSRNTASSSPSWQTPARYHVTSLIPPPPLPPLPSLRTLVLRRDAPCTGAAGLAKLSPA